MSLETLLDNPQVRASARLWQEYFLGQIQIEAMKAKDETCVPRIQLLGELAKKMNDISQGGILPAAPAKPMLQSQLAKL